MVPVDLVADRAAKAIGARAEAEALLHQAAGERVELGDAAGARDVAAADPAVRLYGEGDADAAADPGIAEALGIVGRKDVAGDLDEIGAPALLAIALPAVSSASCGSDGRSGAASSA